MKHIIPLIIETITQGENAALLTVLRRDGSAPRGAGACMLVGADGSTHGTIGGGALEHEASRLAQACIKDGRSALFQYRLSPNQAGEVGMVCGGEVLLHCWLLTREQSELFAALNDALCEGRDAWLERMISADGAVLSAKRIPAFDGDTPVLVEGDTLSFTEPVSLCSYAYVFGGGHIAAELVPMLNRLDFSPVVFDDRVEFANNLRFPDARKVIVGDFNSIGDYVSVTRRDYVVIMTRGHSYDGALLSQALRTEAAYIGLIGSRSKIAHTKSLLIEEGFCEADFARVHTPIGLSILAETPAEIAVSIAAQMVLHRAQLRAERKAAYNAT